MDRDLPLPAQSLFKRQPSVIEPALVQIFGVSVGSRLPRKNRDSIERELKLALRFGKFSLTRAQRELGAFPVLDVVTGPIPGDHVPAVITQRHAADEVPAIFSIRSPH